MERLSMRTYVWKCVLGAEIAYVVCLFGGLFAIRSASGAQLHRALFEMFPGFQWLTTGSVLLGAVYMFVFAWLFGAYYVWMHNSSMEKK